MRKWLFLTLLLVPALAMADDCITSGPGGSLCVERSKASPVATQQWSPAYDCYQQYGMCTRLPDGKCGWLDKGSLAQCIKDPAAFKPQLQHGGPAVPDQIAPPVKE
jgi:hypothetical protein